MPIGLSYRFIIKILFKVSNLKIKEFVGDLPTEMVEHFFKSLVENAKFTCHLKTKGENTHHIVESSFKSFAKAFVKRLN